MRRKPRHRSLRAKTMLPPALRALSLCVPAALVSVLPAPVRASEPAANAGAFPARPLAQALEAFANQTGLQLVYVSGLVVAKKSHPVPAGLSVSESLTRMLEGTHLSFQYLTPRSIRIVAVAASPAASSDTTPADDSTLEQVIVTANRREEYAQDVPMTLQVLTGATLDRLNVTTFDDFVTSLPGVTAHGVGPGQNNLYIRGLATSTDAVQSAGGIGNYPNVGVYLDDQSTQLPHRNLDVYAADLERIEVLEGPQGTLFGAGAEAGVLRYITNKPRLDVTEARLNAGGATTAHGAQSSNFTAVINVPVVTDRFAVRAVIYNEQRGGYIDNPHAVFVRATTDAGIVNYFNKVVPANSAVADNARLVGNDINSIDYRGLRLQALYRFNDDWNVLLSQVDQDIRADGIFTTMAENATGQAQPELTNQLFNPSYDKDRFRSTALTVNGRVGALKLLYAGSFFRRNVEQAQDYTQYSRGPFAAYYQCINFGTPTPASQCFTPSTFWQESEGNRHDSHELRISTPRGGSISAVVGLYYEKYRIEELADWSYVTALSNFHQIGPPTGYYTSQGSPYLQNGTLVQYYTSPDAFVSSPVTSINPNLRPPGVSFFDDITRGYTQKAAYASLDLALIPKTLLLTVGTRYSSTNNTEVGSTVGSYGCGFNFGIPPDPCLNHSNALNIDVQHLDKTYSGFTSRASLSWHAGPDAMLYATWSQGFRAGGFNRAPIGASKFSPLAANNHPNQVQATLHGGYVSPVSYAPDTLTNDELGWKTRWLNRRLQWNGAIYQERWNDTQVQLYGFGIANISAIINGGGYRVRGLETSAIARVTNALTIEAGAAWNQSALVRQATLLWHDGTPIDFSSLVENNKPLPDPNGQLGTPLAAAPPFQAYIRARYEFTYNGFGLFGQVGAKRQSHSYTSNFHLANDLQGHSTVYDLPAFSTYDAALGASKGPWVVQLYGENLADTRAQLFAYYAASYKAVTPNRPRTIGLRFAYSFGSTTDPLGR